MNKWKSGNFRTKEDDVEIYGEFYKENIERASNSYSKEENNSVKQTDDSNKTIFRVGNIIFGVLILIILFAVTVNSEGNKIGRIKTLAQKQNTTSSDDELMKGLIAEIVNENEYEYNNKLLDMASENATTEYGRNCILIELCFKKDIDIDMMKVYQILEKNDSGKVKGYLESLIKNSDPSKNEKAFLEVIKSLEGKDSYILKIYESYKTNSRSSKDEIYKLDLTIDAISEAFLLDEIDNDDFHAFVSNKSNNEKYKAYVKVAESALKTKNIKEISNAEKLLKEANLSLSVSEKKKIDSLLQEIRLGLDEEK